jgi:hypothetical protein
MRLRDLDRHAEAEVIENLQQREVKEQDITHLLFTFSGNDPADALSQHAKSPKKTIERRLVGIVVADHQAFIKSVFESIK